MDIDTSTPFSKWKKEDLQNVLNQCLAKHVSLSRIPRLKDEDFRSLKREFVQPAVDHIYNEIFYSDFPFTELWVTGEEILILDKFAEDYVAYKIASGEPGWARDKGNGKKRVFTGACGHLAVLKSLGGSIRDMDLTLGPSKEYNVPDMYDWLGYPVGIKTASVIDYTSNNKRKVKSMSNLPLLLDYKNFTKAKIAKWTKDNLKYEERCGIEGQIIVATKDFWKRDPKWRRYKTKCYIIGVVSPEIIINNASTAFTLDPNAANDSKPGGAKAGFYGLSYAEPFKTKEELINIVSRSEYQLIPYDEINGHVDMGTFYDFNNKQFG